MTIQDGINFCFLFAITSLICYLYHITRRLEQLEETRSEEMKFDRAIDDMLNNKKPRPVTHAVPIDDPEENDIAEEPTRRVRSNPPPA